MNKREIKEKIKDLGGEFMANNMKYDYATMTKSDAETTGMQIVKGRREHVRAYINKEDFNLSEKGDQNSKIRIVIKKAT